VRVVVVGAGVAGLAAGYRLLGAAKRMGRPLGLVVLEGEPYPGGHARTIREPGFLVETGPDAFLDRPREPQVRELVRELGLEARVVEASAASRRRSILLGGRLRRAPDSPLTLLASEALGAAGKLRVLMEPWAHEAPAGVEETVFEFACRRIGAEAAERLVDAAVAGVSAGDSRRLSIEAAFPLLKEMERDHGSLLRAMAARRREGKVRLLAFDGGMAVLVDALRQRLGPALCTSRPARGIDRARGGWEVGLDGGESIAAERVILATPASRAASLVASLDPELSASLGAFRFSGLAMVALAFPSSATPRLDGYGYLVGAAEGLDTLGVVFESSLFHGRAPQGAVLLRVMMGGTRRPEVVALGEPELVERARRELAGPLGIRAEPVRAWVRRWPAAIAQYEVGHRGRVEASRRLLERHPGLDLCGASYDGISFGSAIASGLAAAERVLAADHVKEPPISLAHAIVGSTR